MQMYDYIIKYLNAMLYTEHKGVYLTDRFTALSIRKMTNEYV